MLTVTMLVLQMFLMHIAYLVHHLSWVCRRLRLMGNVQNSYLLMELDGKSRDPQFLTFFSGKT